MTDPTAAARQSKVDALIAQLLSTEAGAQMLAASLEKSGLKPLTLVDEKKFPRVDDPVRLSLAKTGVLIDCETTGLETDDQETNDEIIELAMVKFLYDDEGILAIDDIYETFNEPQRKPITEEITSITKITPEMVAGQRIDPDEVKDFLQGCGLAVAHNAEFDRKMLENNLPSVGFDRIAFACSAFEIDWKARGKNGRSLELLALSEGLVYGAHRGRIDCVATAFVLNSETADGQSAFAELLDRARQDSILIIAENSPFEQKDLLKEAGYMWSSTGKEAMGKKAWFKQVVDRPELLEAEAEVLKKVYKRDVSLPAYRLNARVRHSGRRPQTTFFFSTKEVLSLNQLGQQADLALG